MKQMLRRRSAFVGSLAVAIAAVVAPLAAHHGWGTYSNQEFEITGTVEKTLDLAGPHATMKIRVDKDLWDLTLAPPGRTTASGLKEGVVPMGARVTAHGHRSQDAKRFEVKTERLTWNNRVFNVYPDRD
jgi:hypothetical protein